MVRDGLAFSILTVRATLKIVFLLGLDICWIICRFFNNLIIPIKLCLKYLYNSKFMQLIVCRFLTQIEQAKMKRAGKKWGGNHEKKYYYRPRKKRMLELQAKLNLSANEIYAQIEREQDYLLSKSLWPR